MLGGSYSFVEGVCVWEGTGLERERVCSGQYLLTAVADKNVPSTERQ